VWISSATPDLLLIQYSAELVLLNKRQISGGGGAYLDCYQ